MANEEHFIAASTTDSTEDIQRALGIDPVPAADTPAETAEAPDAPAPTGEADEPVVKEEASTEPQEPAEERRRRSNKATAQERINQLVLENRKRRADAELIQEENEILKRRLEMRASAPAADAPAPEAPAKPAEPADGKPVQDNFETYDAFMEALTDWKVSQRLAAKEAADREAAMERARQAYQQRFEQRLDEAAAVYPDFHEVIEAGQNLPVTAPMRDAITGSPVAGHLMYFLNRNAETCLKIAELSRYAPAEAIKEIGRIEAAIFKVGREQGKTSAPESAEPARAGAPSQRQVSKAPPPPPSVRSGNGTNAGVPRDPTKITNLKDWEAYMASQNS